MNAAVRSHSSVPKTSLAFDNLRALVILLVLSFHSVLAYLNFLPSSPFPFNAPPYLWRAFPIVDTERWFGFDIYCAWQDVFLMSRFFFRSGLFVWPSLERKGAGRFLHDRVLRLGMPFAVVVAFLIPLATYPTYLQTATQPGFMAFWRHWLE
ncbi:MAG: acyltransferase family protein, partial [Alphaproteobacteria bacterium]|nr:acyltransferase family protein [Alphaproteobacteria bacterium]